MLLVRIPNEPYLYTNAYIAGSVTQAKAQEILNSCPGSWVAVMLEIIEFLFVRDYFSLLVS